MGAELLSERSRVRSPLSTFLFFVLIDELFGIHFRAEKSVGNLDRYSLCLFTVYFSSHFVILILTKEAAQL